MLREHAIEAGLDPDFGQLEPIDAEVEIYGWIETALDLMWEAEPEAAIGFARAFSPKDERGGMDVTRQVSKLIESARCWAMSRVRNPAVIVTNAPAIGWRESPSERWRYLPKTRSVAGCWIFQT